MCKFVQYLEDKYDAEDSAQIVRNALGQSYSQSVEEKLIHEKLIINAQTAGNLARQVRQTFEKLENSGLPSLKQRALETIYRQSSTVFQVYDLDEENLLDWFTKLGYDVKYTSGRYIINY